MKRCHPILSMVACLLALSGPYARAQEKATAETSKDIETQLKETMLDNIKSTEAEDMHGTMATIHTKSPFYQATRKQLSQLFGKQRGLKYELVSLKYLATDGDFAVARVVQRTTQKPPATIKDNESDMLVAFRKEGKSWKFWNQALLEVKFLKP